MKINRPPRECQEAMKKYVLNSDRLHARRRDQRNALSRVSKLSYQILDIDVSVEEVCQVNYHGELSGGFAEGSCQKSRLLTANSSS